MLEKHKIREQNAVNRLRALHFIGKKFNKLTITEILGVKRTGIFVKCKCECGNSKETYLTSLKRGDTRSCGCLFGTRRRTHGDSKTKLYNVYHKMKLRCLDATNPAYKNYGGRGIAIIEEWINSFKVFRDWALLNGYKESLELDRIDNNSNYEPANCRFTTKKVNANNKRNNTWLKFNGQNKTCAQWTDLLGFSRGVIWYRINSNWSIEEALTTPIRKHK